MRISTSQMFQRGLNSILDQLAKTAKIQQQLSSGKRVQSPSDDPIAATRINLMKERIEATNRLELNREAADNALRFEESALTNSMQVLQNLRGLQVQAGNGAMSQSDREAFGIEVQNLLDQLYDIANTKDSSGFYIFSGAQSTTQAITLNMSGQYVYNGDDTQRMQKIGGSLQVAINDTAADVFIRVPSGNGDFSVSQTGAANTGNAVATTGTVTDPGSYVPDDYTVQFVLNSSSELVVMVTGATSGNVIPPTGLPDDAPLYTSGEAINFNGLEITVTGDPDPGDDFLIQPSQNESIFSTAKRMVDNLNQPFGSVSEKATVQTENNQLIAQLDSAIDSILRYQSEVGARLKQLDVAEQINDDLIVTSESTLDQLEKIDLNKAAVDLNNQLIYLQAAQQSFGRIQSLSLFNFI